MKLQILLTLVGLVACVSGKLLHHNSQHHQLKLPPLVPDGYSTDCHRQKTLYPHLSCQDSDAAAVNESFNPLQCTAGLFSVCYCVNPRTGLRPAVSHILAAHKKHELNCTAELSKAETCKAVYCNNICYKGYALDESGCQTCTCKLVEPGEMCKTHAQLLADGCHCDCIRLPAMGCSDCPTCDLHCMSSIAEQNTDSSGCATASECHENQTLMYVGRFGRAKCVDLLPSGSVCGIARNYSEHAAGLPEVLGAKNRSFLNFAWHKHHSCRNDLSCRQTSFKHKTCQHKHSHDMCQHQLRDGGELHCSEEGGFKPLQCRPLQGGEYSRECHCVNATTGDMIEGTEVQLRPSDKNPHCHHHSYRNCSVRGLLGKWRKNGYHFHVHHSKTFFDALKCRSCQCLDGVHGNFCSNSSDKCSLLVPKDSPQNCTFPSGETLQHKHVVRAGCAFCGCFDGRLKCAYLRHCNLTTPTESSSDRCLECEKQHPPGPVCGSDGRNHISLCSALHCAGVPPTDIHPAPCQSRDPCQEYPCGENEVCQRKGGVACLGSKGCLPEQLRTCIASDDLQCPTNSSDRSQVFCGSDGRSYLSECHMMQTTYGVHVLHEGACYAVHCRTGPVCGSDGVTYPNRCVLHSQSVAQVDYKGPCEEHGGAPLEDHCSNVRKMRRCLHHRSHTNCSHLVQPQDGCCPVCGGAVTISLDRHALDEASEGDQNLGTLDGFVSRLLQFEAFRELHLLCHIATTLTRTSDLHLVVSAVGLQEAELCHTMTHLIAHTVNNAGVSVEHIGAHHNVSGAGHEEVTTLPQAYDFAMAAVAELAVQRDLTGDRDGTAVEGGGVCHTLPPALSLLSLLLGAAALV